MIGIKLGLIWGGGGAPFTPRSIGAVAWYDPSDLSTLFQDSAGTTPVTAVGQQVGRMLDKSGRGNHATQTTLTSRPILQIDANGKYYLDCDGVDDWMVTSAINFTITDKLTICAGLKRDVDASGIVAELSTSSLSKDGAFYLVAGADVGFIGYTSLGRGTATSSINQNATMNAGQSNSIVSATHDIAGDLSRILVNGVAGNSATGDKGAGNFGNYPLYLFRRGEGSFPFNGRMYGFVIAPSLLSTANLTRLETYMNRKTGAY